MACNLYEYSFIVPVYNAEKYIEECIESILKQGECCELILVDDGSTDSSGEICDWYAGRYERIKVFHNKNSGPGAARNFGLDKASGNYVIFVDSDDYVSNGLIEYLDRGYADRSADLIFFNIIKKFSDGRLEPMAEGLKKDEIYGKPMNKVLHAISECSKFPASTGGKIIKRDVLIKNNIRFKEGVIGEDIDWTLQLICNINSADVYTIGNYYYRISPNTRRSYGNSESLCSQLSIIEDWICKVKDEKINKYILSFLAYQYAVSLPFYGALAADDRMLYIKRTKELRFLLSYGKTKKIKLIRLAVSLIGVNAASKLLYKYVVKRDEYNA
ncbi:MAG: glycosyltransferase family 2 protein [Firmicutes bacterium]|nr:glycosyltransferase family 2 protein [Bacillota bacterium]